MQKSISGVYSSAESGGEGRLLEAGRLEQRCLKVGVCLLQCEVSLSLPSKAHLVPLTLELSSGAAKGGAEMQRHTQTSGMLNP